MTDEPDDATVVADILAAPPAARAELARALTAVEDLGPGYATPWATPEGQFPYPQYPEQVDRLRSALVHAGACPTFDWMHWPAGRPPWRPADIAAAPLAHVARLVTTMLRSERFSEGSLAGALEEGSLVAAARRIVEAQSGPA